jgi:tetratricopeptide (TPR) repeat protein
MKKQVIVALALSVSLYTFAQKKEVKEFEKAVSKENFTEAKAMIPQLEPMLGAMDDKLKAKYYFNKAQALYANGKIQLKDIDVAIESLNKAEGEYKGEVAQMRKLAENTVLQTANNAYTAGNYEMAAKGFETLYKLNSSDQTYLYYASQSALQAKNYDEALRYFLQLKDIGYTGEEMQYFAVNKLSDERELLDKATRDNYIKLGTHIQPTEQMSDSKESEIVKNIALIYIQKGENEKALEAIKDAREKNPDDANLVISEANINLELGNTEKASDLFKLAISKDPNNPDLIYNVGVLAMTEEDNTAALDFFKKTLEVDPSYSNAALNISTIQINNGNALNEKMNALGTSSADFKKYDVYKAEKSEFFKAGAKTLEDFIAKNPKTKNLDVLNQLKNIYNALGNTAKVNDLNTKIAAIEKGM